MDPKTRLRGDHEHASRLRMHVVARVLGHEHPASPIIILRHLAKGEKSERVGAGVLGEIDQGFGEAELPEHLVTRDRPFAGCVEEDVRLFLGVLVIVGNGAFGLEGRVVDG